MDSIIVEYPEHITEAVHGLTFGGISLDIIIPAAVAFIIFYFGHIFTTKRDQIREYQRLKDIEAYFYSLTDGLLVGAEKQVNSFKSLSEQLKIKKHQDLIAEYVSEFNLDNINKIDSNDLFKIFITLISEESELKINYYNKIMKSITQLNGISELWREEYDECIRRQLEYNRRWNSSMGKIGKIVNDFVHEVKMGNIHPSSDSFFKEFDDIVGTFQKTEDRNDIYKAITHLIEPLYNLCTKYPSHNWSLLLLEPVMSCEYAFDNYEKNRNVYANQFEMYASKMTNARVLLDESIQEIKRLRSKKPRLGRKWY
ncbi:MAG: hypothetical protein HQ509_02260 [Candidatus Marinimicrobia bacterium]|nr:hypothetical protein [Candidatus Neomarinimicrobiota bacterium]